jgi:hypothetical protein
LDGQRPPDSNVLFMWELDSSRTDTDTPVELDNPNIRTPFFYAPHVEFDSDKGQNNNTYTTLTFKLVVTHKRTGLLSDPSMVTIIVKMIQRALILQGGGALGAYELGVYRALCERLIEKDRSDGARKNRPLFDIIAGASIGALNATLIVHSTHCSKRSASEKRAFKDLIEGRFDVTRVIYIDREDDQDTIFGKAADFSRETIVNLEKLGYDDAQKAIQEHADLLVSKEGYYKISRESCLLYGFLLLISLIQDDSSFRKPNRWY